MGILSAETELTVRALLGRRVIKIMCCEFPMLRKDVYSHLPGSNTGEKTIKPYPFSEVYLVCSRCERELRVDLALDRTNVADIWKYVQEDMFSQAKTKKAKKKEREENSDADL